MGDRTRRQTEIGRSSAPSSKSRGGWPRNPPLRGCCGASRPAQAFRGSPMPMIGGPDADPALCPTQRSGDTVSRAQIQTDIIAMAGKPRLSDGLVLMNGGPSAGHSGLCVPAFHTDRLLLGERRGQLTVPSLPSPNRAVAHHRNARRTLGWSCDRSTSGWRPFEGMVRCAKAQVSPV